MYDSAEELAPKVTKLIEMIREAEHPIVYTGAGISTSANIPDYRGTGGVYVWDKTVFISRPNRNLWKRHFAF